MDVAHQAPLSMRFYRQEYWSGLPFPPPGDLSDPGIQPGLLHCMLILYSLSHQVSPWAMLESSNSIVVYLLTGVLGLCYSYICALTYAI